MPITSDLGGKNYTLGRGRLFAARFTAAQVSAGITAATMPEGGYKYIGNTPEIAITSEEETLDHFDSDSGIRTKDDSVSLQVNRTGSFTTDNIDVANLGMLFLADGVNTVTQLSATAATYVFNAAAPGHFIQVGQTAALPTGVRNISNVSVRTGAGFTTVVTPTGNYEVDEALGRIYILPGAPAIPAGTAIQVTYDAAAGTRQQVISKSTSIYVALQYVADNPRGTNRDVVMPLVKLAPNGDYNLKGDEWQQISFSMEVLKKGSLEAIYIDGRPA